MPKHFIAVDELVSYLLARGIDCRKNSRQLLTHLRALFDREVPMKNLVLAAVLAGYAVVPRDGGQVFTFCQVAD